MYYHIVCVCVCVCVYKSLSIDSKGTSNSICAVNFFPHKFHNAHAAPPPTNNTTENGIMSFRET